MRRPSLLLGALLGGLTALPLITLSYLGQQLAKLPFVPFDLFDWLARFLPGSVIRVGIDAIVRLITLTGLGPISDTAKHIEQMEGIVLVLIGGVLVGLVITWVVRHSHWSGTSVGTVAGLVVFALILAIEANLKTISANNASVALPWLAILTVGWGALLGRWLTAKELAPEPSITPEFQAARRVFLIKLAGGSIGVALASFGIGRWLESQTQASGAGQSLSQLGAPTPEPTPPTGSVPITGGTPTPEPTPPIGNVPITGGMPITPTVLAGPSEWTDAAPGTRADITPNDAFYRIDIDTLPPVIGGKSWVLAVKGLFDHPRPLMLSDLLAYPTVTQPVTLSCISNPVGGDLISTSRWMGVRLRDVLHDLGLRPEAKELYITTADGFYESVEMQDMLDPRTLLVYGMNGETLPIEHGFPLRIYIPNHYGMKQPKWITSIEAIDHNGRGYWVDRGWSAEARPQIISVIDTVAKDAIVNGGVPVGGIAWAGDRGIQKVEVQVDGGAWADAILQSPPLSGLTWVLWRYDWPRISGRHIFRVRATDGTGLLQTTAEHDTFPDGATGFHSVTVTI